MGSGSNAPETFDGANDEVTTIPVALGTVAGRYKLEQELGSGGMGAVYSAVDLKTQQTVALKLMNSNRSSTRTQRFLREARATISLAHPHIVQLLDFGSDEQYGYFQVLELLEGETLDERMRRDTFFELAEVVAIAGPILSATLAAHASGLVHRDLKPANIFLAREGARAVPKLIDFGTVRDVGSNTGITQLGRVVGTPLYMAPEQIRGERIGSEVDLWSFGVIVFEMVVGRRPFEAKRLSGLVLAQKQGAEGAFPRDHPLAGLVTRCLQYDPRQRRLQQDDLRAVGLF